MSKIRASGLKRRLYCRVSALVLAAAGCAGAAAAQPGAGGFWIDLSGGYNFDAGGALDTFPSDTLAGPQRVRPRADWDIDGKIGYQASGSPWVVDLGVKYGRTFKRSRSFSGSTPGYYYGYPYAQSARSSTNVTHTVVDFEVGRDVGMGAAGPTTLGLGVRYAHFDA
ncbi:MAG: hypothetical protein ACREEB_12875 [Caulobacteraceae bacterium]